MNFNTNNTNIILKLIVLTESNLKHHSAHDK